ncbi:MAG: hypothetical protein J0H09_20080 [Burkholderiales bacterium]|nr:hypothetical protein [Burkholderiales bacterium]
MSSSEPKGLLLAMMEPPAGLEEEFADWYDNEHVPERAAIPGFLTALRWVCVSGWPRYVAIYDLERLGVLDEPGYQAVSGERFSPWSKRVLSKVRGQYRAAAVQIFPGDAVTGTFASLTLLRWRGIEQQRENDLVVAVREAAAAHETALGGGVVNSVRVYRFPNQGVLDHLAMIEWSVGPDAAGGFRPPPAFSRELDLVNVYVPYWVRGRLPGVYH